MPALRLYFPRPRTLYPTGSVPDMPKRANLVAALWDQVPSFIRLRSQGVDRPESKNLLAVGFFPHLERECSCSPTPARTRTLEISHLPPKTWFAVLVASALLILPGSPGNTQRQSFAKYRTRLVRCHVSH